MTSETNEATIPTIADRGRRMERMLADTEAVLNAIQMGGLLDAVPAQREEQPRHSTAVSLLDQLLERVRGCHAEVESFGFHSTSEDLMRLA
jgi:hypothetical protein